MEISRLETVRTDHAILDFKAAATHLPKKTLRSVALPAQPGLRDPHARGASAPTCGRMAHVFLK